MLTFIKPPTLEFYKKLHWFLNHWSFTRNAGKTAVGRFYLAIDPYIKQRMFIPHNAYRFISQQVSSDVEVHDTPDYKIKGTVTVTVEYNDTIKHIEEMKNVGENY